MDISKTVKDDTLGPLSSILVPGIILTFPYVAHFLFKNDNVALYFSSHEATSIIVATFTAIIFGLIVDALGRTIESHVIDEMHKDASEVREEWFKYLNLVHDPEPICQRFLRKVLLQFKFELNLGLALIFSLPGLIW